MNATDCPPPAYRAWFRRAALIGFAAVGLGGCIVPKDAPTGNEVKKSAELTLADAGRLSYALVKLSPLVLSTMETERQSSLQFSKSIQTEGSADVRIGPSDSVTITIFEAASGGLFIPNEAGSRSGNFIQVPPQEVDRNGNVSVPYAGAIKALGRAPNEIGSEIESKLRQRAIEPQVVVTVGERTSFVVSVLGDVNQPTTISLRPGGLRLLSAIARAGGAKYPAHETYVTLQRKGRTEKALLSVVAKDPSQNIQLTPEDVVYVAHEPRIFMAFGATPDPGAIGAQNSRRFVFEQENVTMAEGLARIGGLLSGRADPKAVFLFRYTPRSILKRAGVDPKRFPGDQVPTVYSLDISEAEGYFLAEQFYLKDRDIIVVSESPAVDIVKVFDVLNSVTAAGQGATGLGLNVRGLR